MTRLLAHYIDTVGCSHVTDFGTPGCRKSSRSYSQQCEVGILAEDPAHDQVEEVDDTVDRPVEPKNLGPSQHLVADVAVLGPVRQRTV